MTKFVSVQGLMVLTHGFLKPLMHLKQNSRRRTAYNERSEQAVADLRYFKGGLIAPFFYSSWSRTLQPRSTGFILR